MFIWQPLESLDMAKVQFNLSLHPVKGASKLIRQPSAEEQRVSLGKGNRGADAKLAIPGRKVGCGAVVHVA